MSDLAPALHIRRALPQDASSIALVHYEAIRSWQDVLAASYVQARSLTDFQQKWQCELDPARALRPCRAPLSSQEDVPEAMVSTTWMSVSSNEKEVYGFVTVGSAVDLDLRDQQPPCGLIGRLYVAPGYQRKGTGRALLQMAMEWMKVGGYQPVFLWVFADNSRARRFYEREGFAPDGATKCGYDLQLLRYKHTQPPLAYKHILDA